MTWLDWLVVGIFFAISLVLGTIMTRRASRGFNAYFASDHQLSWWLAGTSMAATAFSSDTPLLITGMVRRRGVWGTWEVLALSISTMLAVFVFAKLWKRAKVLTEVQLVESRYSGNAAAVLRGFKAIYWGLLYNCFVLGAWPVTGLRKVLEETTNLSRSSAIVLCVLIGTIYTSCSGLWGVVVTDLFQFVWAMIGAFLLAVFAVHAAGGLGALSRALQPTGALNLVPPLPSGEPWLSSSFGWFLGLILIQWWAWKNTDGGGIIVQRLISCRDERQAVGSVLWFNIAQYCLRAWPWILTALASLVLIPNEALRTSPGSPFIDHERAYPRLIMQLLPAGLRGVMVAAFFAAFLSTLSTQLNWGASYLVNDFYKRFLNRRASERHYLRVARLMPFVLALGAIAVAFTINSIGETFTLILNLTAGMGPVYLLRWFWWRVNPWSELSAMIASVPILMLRPHLLAWLGLPDVLIAKLGVMILGTALIWVPMTLLTPPVDRQTLKRFYMQVRPPGWWRPVAAGQRSHEPWMLSLIQWGLGTVAILGTALGPVALLTQQVEVGGWWCGFALIGWGGLVWTLVRRPTHAG